MPPQLSGNGTQFAGDDRTRLLASVGRGADCGNPECRLRRVGIEHRHDRDRGHPVFLRPAELTAVIPVTPAQPEQPRANDSDPWKEGCPWLIAVGFVLAAVLLLTGIGLGAWWF